MSAQRSAKETTPEERRRELALPSYWAERRRVIAGAKWTFVGREYLRDPHDDFARHIVVKKAAQMGFTELAQNRLAHAIDRGRSAMMVLPTDDDVKRHSKARFKQLCESSPFIGEMFQEIDSVDVKRSGEAALYFEGAVSPSAAHSVPIAALVIDEIDMCLPAVVEKFDLRLSGHVNPWRMDISTPHNPNGAVTVSYADSDQKRWIVACPKCEWRGPLSDEGPFESWKIVTWEGAPAIPERDRMEAAAKTARIKCPGCGSTWNEKQRKEAVSAGKWVASFPDRMTSGYAINQLSSSTVTVAEFVLHYFKAHHDPDPSKMREFINQRVGEPYIGEGEEITESMVRKLVVPAMVTTGGTSLALGADVGKAIHVVLGGRWGGKLHVLRSFEVDGWDDLDNLIASTGAQSVVVDMNPERRDSEEFCLRHPGVAFRAYHPEGMRATYNWDGNAAVVQIAHAPAVDLLLNRIRTGVIELHNAGEIEQLVRHLLHVNVVLETNAKGAEERRVIKTGADHLAFACVYLEAAASRFVDESFTPTIVQSARDDAFASARGGEFACASDSWATGERDLNQEWRDF